MLWQRLCLQYGYVVIAPEYKGAHYTMNRVDYVGWIRAYPKETQLWVSVKGELVID